MFEYMINGKIKKLFLLIMLVLLGEIYTYAQAELPQKIRISQGDCTAMCGYRFPFDNINYKNQLEYDLNKKTYRFRKKSKKKFKEICNIESKLLTKVELYDQLDQLYQKAQDISTGAGKYYIYKIELIYFKNELELPSRIKGIEFLETDVGNDLFPKVLSELIEEYKKIRRTRQKCN